MKRILLSIVIVFVLLGCGGVPQLNTQVCNVGQMICDVGSSLCSSGAVSDPVCSYLNIACINLALLCTEPPGSEAYIKAENELKKANLNMKRWVEKIKKAKDQESDNPDN